MSMTLAVQDALHAALDSALSMPIYVGEAPGNTSMPYVTVDSVMATSQTQVERKGDTIRVYLTVWTNTRGNAAALNALETIRTAVEGARLTLSTGTMVRTYYQSGSTEPDIDNRIHKGRATLRVLATR